MPIVYICPICREQFLRRDIAVEHIKEKHKEHVTRLLSQLTKRRIEGLLKRGINPENWAAGYILSMLSPE